MPKLKFHHPGVFPEGGASIQSTVCYSEQHARQFPQMFHIENQVKNTTKPRLHHPTHMLIHEKCG